MRLVCPIHIDLSELYIPTYAYTNIVYRTSSQDSLSITTNFRRFTLF